MISIILIIVAIGLININPLTVGKENKVSWITRLIIFVLSLLAYVALTVIYPSQSVWLAIGVIIVVLSILFIDYLKSKNFLAKFFNALLLILFIPVLFSFYMPEQYQQVIDYRETLISASPIKVNIWEILVSDINQFEDEVEVRTNNIFGD